MKKGALIINAYTESGGQLNQIKRLQEEFEKLGVTLNVFRNRFLSYIDNGNLKSPVGEADFVIYTDKDKYYARMLEKSGYRLFNSANAIELSDDKMLTYITLSKSGIEIPDTVSCPLNYSVTDIDGEFLNKVVEFLGLPLVIKNCHGSLGAQVYKIDDEKQLNEVYQRLMRLPHLYQRYLKSSYGKDCRVIVIDGKAVASMNRVNISDFRSNLEQGGVGEKCSLTEEQRFVAEKAAKILGLEYCGIDLLYGEKGQPVFCEANGNAFFKGIERVTGINVAGQFAKYIYDTIYGK